MTTILILLALYTALGMLVRFARHDRFAGPHSVAEAHDELGSLLTRDHLVPRR